MTALTATPLADLFDSAACGRTLTEGYGRRRCERPATLNSTETT